MHFIHNKRTTCSNNIPSKGMLLLIFCSFFSCFKKNNEISFDLSQNLQNFWGDQIISGGGDSVQCELPVTGFELCKFFFPNRVGKVEKFFFAVLGLKKGKLTQLSIRSNGQRWLQKTLQKDGRKETMPNMRLVIGIIQIRNRKPVN